MEGTQRTPTDNEKKKTPKPGTIVKQLSRPMILVFGIIIVASAVFLFLYSLSVSIEDKLERCYALGENAAAEMERYHCLTFLVDYWDAHYQEMELAYDDSLLEEKEKRLSVLMPGVMDMRLITNEEALALDEEGQELLAEICHSRICAAFDTLKRIYTPVFLASFRLRDGCLFFYTTGTLLTEKRLSQGGDLYDLGTQWEYTEGVYPVLDRVLQTQEHPDHLELSLNKGALSTFVHSFNPVFDGDKMVCVVGMSSSWTDLIHRSLAASIALFVVFTLAMILVGYILFRIVQKRIVWPLRKECGVIEAYEADKDAEKVSRAMGRIQCGNELDRVAESFSSMAEELDRYMDEIREAAAERANMETELTVAANIQAGMLPEKFPAFPDRTEFDIYASMTPAKEVGGDFYDFFLIDHDHLGLVIADVSGKGVPAALFMMMSKIVIQGFISGGAGPAEALANVNRKLCERNPEEMFVTVWLGCLDLTTGKLKAANAGHEYPFIRHPGGDFEMLKDPHGFVLGGMPGMKYKEYEVQLEPGAAVFVYTDGVTEATNALAEMFGTDRIREALNGAEGNSPAELLRAVDRSVRDFVKDAPQFDDETMLCVLYKGKDN